MYATDDDQSVALELSAIEVAEVKSRLGRDVRNALIRQFEAGGRDTPTRYLLSFKMTDTTVGAAVRVDDTITRYNYRLIASYILQDKASGTRLHGGTARATGAYDVVTSQFATLAAQRDVEQRTAREVAAEIRLRVSRYFATAAS